MTIKLKKEKYNDTAEPQCCYEEYFSAPFKLGRNTFRVVVRLIDCGPKKRSWFATLEHQIRVSAATRGRRKLRRHRGYRAGYGMVMYNPYFYRRRGVKGGKTREEALKLLAKELYKQCRQSVLVSEWAESNL